MVEGTMRNPQVPYNTAKMFKENGYEVEILAISAPSVFTELGLYNRYQEEINFQGWGRLAEIESHNLAVSGILASLDLLYNEKPWIRFIYIPIKQKAYCEFFITKQ